MLAVSPANGLSETRHDVPEFANGGPAPRAPQVATTEPRRLQLGTVIADVRSFTSQRSVRITPSANLVHVVIPLTGGMTAVMPQGAHRVAPGTALLLAQRERTDCVWFAGARGLVLHVSRTAIQAQAFAAFDEPRRLGNVTLLLDLNEPGSSFEAAIAPLSRLSPEGANAAMGDATVAGLVDMLRLSEEAAGAFPIAASVKRAIDHLRHTSRTACPPEQLACIAGVTLPVLRRNFKDCLGVTLTLFMLDARLEWARERLTSTRETRSIADLAAATGLNGVGVFTRAWMDFGGLMSQERRLRASTAALLVIAGLAIPASVRAQVTSSASAPAVPSFDVRAIQVKGNTILSPGQVEDIVYPFMGPGKTSADIETARAALQKAFEEKGYATVSVFIPEQSVDSGIIRLEVQAQTIGTVAVAGGRRTGRDWVRGRAPSLTPGTVPNFTDLQRDIVALNRSADRKITPEVKAGIGPGTVDVVLKVEDSSPFHGSVELNNFTSAQTSALRLSGSLRYDDLWARGDSISLSTQIAPEDTGDGAIISANYLARLGDVQLLAYGVHSESDIAIVGGINVIGSGNIIGSRLIVPLGQGERFYSAVTVGLDYKDFKEDLLLGADRDAAPITYFPASLNWRGDWTGEGVRTSLSLSGTLGLRGLGDGAVTFDRKRFHAKPNFYYVRVDATRQQDLSGSGSQAYLHLSGQWAGDPLISNEQYSLGGMETVRGYFESEALTDYGVAIQSELRSPPLGGLIGVDPDALRFHVFLDGGVGGLIDALPTQDRTTSLLSTGVGASVHLFKLFNGAIDIAAPLVDGPNKDTGSITARFRIWGEF